MSEVRDRYQDPGAFRTALTQRLRRLAESSPWTLAELQRQFAYDRFLQRLNAGDDGWVLKGAAALLAREVSTRATRDVDLYRRAELVEAETALREAVALDLGDWFTFEAGRSRQMTAGVIGLTIALTARIGIREWERFNVDLVGEAAGMTGEPETALALARIASSSWTNRGIESGRWRITSRTSWQQRSRPTAVPTGHRLGSRI